MSNFLNQLNERAKEIRDFLNFRERRNIAMVENDPFSIRSIKKPSEAVQLIAVQQEPSTIGDIKRPSPKAQVMAVEKNIGVITLIDSPCEEAQKIAVREEPFASSLIETSEGVKEMMVNNDPSCIRHISDPSETLQMLAVQKEATSIKYIVNPTENVQLAAIRQVPWTFHYIEKPTENVKLEAVKINPLHIKAIKNPSEDIQMAVIERDPWGVLNIDNPTEKVEIKALVNDPSNLCFYEKALSENVQIGIVSQRPEMLKDLRNPSEEVKIAAIKKDPTVLKYIKNPSETILNLAKEVSNQLNGTHVHTGRMKSENDLAVQMNRLWNQAGDNGQRKERILKAYNNIRNNLRSHGFGTKLGDSYRLSSPEERLRPNKVSIEKRIEAIQVLQGNAPERILDEKFNDIREQYPHCSEWMKERICNPETGKTYDNIRMMSDKYYIKDDIFQTAKTFAEEIKDDFSPYNFSKYASDLLKVDNLELGRVPTIKETLSLFSKEYILPEAISSAVFENEVSGKYEITRPILQYNVSKDNNFQFINAGTNPYSPNYKERFNNIGLKNEFQKFEELCIKRDKWNDRYNYAIQSRDIAEIYDLERELPKLDQQIEDSRTTLYAKLKENINCKLEGIKESLNDNGYENISKEIQNNQTSIIEALKADSGSFQIKGVPVTEGRDKLYADITISRKGGNMTLSMNNLSIYNASSVDKVTDANGLLTAMSSQGIKNPLDIHRAHLQDLIMGSAVNVKTASGMKAVHLAQSPAGLTLKVVSGIFQQLDACASN